MSQEVSHTFSDVLTRTVASYIQQKKKILIINNKKGYASGMICRQCAHIPKCLHCDIPIAVCLDEHKLKYSICHICKTLYPTMQTCTLCHAEMVQDYGLGNQKIAERIKQNFQQDSLVIDHKDTQSIAKITKLQARLANYSVIIATSLWTRPTASRAADLIIVTNADSGLQIPDFDTERTHFHLLYELLTAHQTPNYIIQTHKPEHPSIISACRLDYDGFETYIQNYLQTHHYPPYGELAIIIYRHQIEAKLFGKINTLYQDLLYLREKQESDIEIYATPPLIYRIYNTYRYHIIIKGIHIRAFVDQAYQELDIRRKGFHIDRMPVSLLS